MNTDSNVQRAKKCFDEISGLFTRNENNIDEWEKKLEKEKEGTDAWWECQNILDSFLSMKIEIINKYHSAKDLYRQTALRHSGILEKIYDNPISDFAGEFKRKQIWEALGLSEASFERKTNKNSEYFDRGLFKCVFKKSRNNWQVSKKGMKKYNAAAYGKLFGDE
jgi:hypothetical protein